MRIALDNHYDVAKTHERFCAPHGSPQLNPPLRRLRKTLRFGIRLPNANQPVQTICPATGSVFLNSSLAFPIWQPGGVYRVR